MRLLAGPAGSGKTRFCLNELRECLRGRERGCRLLVPASTLAEHLRNTLARDGLVFSPAVVDTFGHFVDSLTPAAREVTSGTLGILVERHLGNVRDGRYLGVRDLPGFRRALASAIESFTGAGGTHASLTGLDPQFQDACRFVLDAVHEAGLCTRAERLQMAADKIRQADAVPGKVWLAGFSGFTVPESELIRALTERSAVTVALSESPAGERTRELLRPMIREQQDFSNENSSQKRIVIACSTPENEAAEVVRRIVAEIEAGRPARHIGVVLRSQNTAANLRLACERFGIPASFHFAWPLQDTPPVRFLNAVLDAAISGWDHELCVAAFRMHGSPLERTGDEWEYAVRERLPGKGLGALREHAPKSAQPWFDELEKAGAWLNEPAPASTWQMRFEGIRALFSAGPVHDRADAARIESWRNDAAALEQFATAVAEAAAVFRASELIPIEEFRRALDTVLGAESIWPRDRRRDVVHVIDAAEARHWRLPLIFVCGLIEGEFPRRFNEDPILPDSDRRRLAGAGVHMLTAAQRQDEEQFLFDTALTRATEATVLTYPVLSSKGDPLTPSFALGRAAALESAEPVLVRPRAARPRSLEPEGAIGSPELLNVLSRRYERLSASAIETFAACPWEFFARRTLRLKAPPAGMWERLDLLAQGNVAHRVAELHFRDGLPVEQAFETVFNQCCEEKRIPTGYRTEAVRLELLHNLRLLLTCELVKPQGSRSLYEHPFSFDLDGLRIDGKMDRVDIAADGSAVVFDYKYSRKERLRETETENTEGLRVQGGLYLRALREMGFDPAGLIWFGFKREIATRGWVLQSLRPDIGSFCDVPHLDEVAATAAATALRLASEIAGGVVMPAPEDEEHCERCDYLAVCRYEVMARRRAATAGGGPIDAAE